VSPIHLIRLLTARRLRQKADRYRNLALTNEDDQDVDRAFCGWMSEWERIQALNPITSSSSCRSA
jgi:hypothetical protein